MENCDLCGDCLTHKGVTDSALGIELDGDHSHPQRQKVLDMFGKDRFRICYCCWLLSLGVKPLEAVSK